MSGKQSLQPADARTQQPARRGHAVDRRPQVTRGTYTIAEVCVRISMPRRTFTRLRDKGELPFLEEVQPRLGIRPRYRADLVDQYVANTFNRKVS